MIPVRTLREAGFKTIMLNYNPETVSTDYDESDRLYFENISLENSLDIYELEQSSGVVVSVGGQTPNNIALGLHREGVKIYGTSPEQIDGAENRYKFSRMCDTIGVDQPRWKELATLQDARSFCDKVDYPVLVRPSYVLSGAAMNVVFSSEDLENYLEKAASVSPEHPVVISKFIEGAKEIEMDAVAKDGKLVYHVISEHVENAGVHSGDATLVLPPQDLEPETIAKIEEATRKIGNALNVTGPFNIQFIAKNNEIKVIECNLRASRSFPFCSKVIGVDLIEMATKAMMGLPFEPYPPTKIPTSGYVCVKVPQFSFSRLSGADPILGVEMASTGEVACFGRDVTEAYMKALISTSFVLPKKNVLLSIGSFKEKQEFLPSVWKLHRMGYNLFATSGTADFLSENGIPVKCLEALDGKEQKAEYSLTQHLANNMIDLYINLPSQNRFRRPASYVSKGYMTRRMAIDLSVPLMTNIKCAKLFVEALGRRSDLSISEVDYKTSHRVNSLPGLVDSAAVVDLSSETLDVEQLTRQFVAGGITNINLLAITADGVPLSVEQLQKAVDLLRQRSFCDFSVVPEITENNLAAVVEFSRESRTVYLRYSSECAKSLTAVTKIFGFLKTKATGSCVITDAKGAYLASILLLANIHGIPVHVSNVYLEEDIELIILNKKNGTDVTCDVSVFNLFLSQEEFPNASGLGNKEDLQALWAHVGIIDCFSTGATLSALVKTAVASKSIAAGPQDVIPLLMTAVQSGKLTIDDVKAKLFDNPHKIFGFANIKSTSIAIEMDRKYTRTVADGAWSPFQGRDFSAKVCRVVLKGQPVFVDGVFTPTESALGKKLVVAPAVVPESTAAAAKDDHLLKVDAPIAALSMGARRSIQVTDLKPDFTSESKSAVDRDKSVETSLARFADYRIDAAVPLDIPRYFRFFKIHS